ncbi:MAG: hypothetical protein Ta2E_10870 [Mycoplasmoidaceae bacterium]|nr:MAG: hypothetical protein Ta2E_10870 [Mycoplasmoidaceae bacterium]
MLKYLLKNLKKDIDAGLKIRNVKDHWKDSMDWFEEKQRIKNLQSSDEDELIEETISLEEQIKIDLRRANQPKKQIPQKISTKNQCEKWWKTVEDNLGYKPKENEDPNFDSLFDMQVFLDTFHKREFRDIDAQLRAWIEEEEEGQDPRPKVEFTQFKEIAGEVQCAVYSWDRILDDMSRYGATVIDTNELVDFLVCMKYQMIFQIAWDTSKKDCYYEAAGEKRKSMNLLIYFWLLWRFWKISTVEFEEKISWMESLLETITGITLKISQLIDPIKTKFENPFEESPVITEEVEILLSKEVWMIDGETTSTEELKDPPTRTLAQKLEHKLNRRRAQRRRKRARNKLLKKEAQEEKQKQEEDKKNPTKKVKFIMDEEEASAQKEKTHHIFQSDKNEEEKFTKIKKPPDIEKEEIEK